MENTVRYFLLRLGTALTQTALTGISTGKLGAEADAMCRRLNVGIPQLRAFQSNPVAMQAILQTEASIQRLAEKLAEGDWEKMSTMLNLLDQVTEGQVLVVEKERYDELETQLPAAEAQPETETFTNTPQL